jgi:cysteine-rich repeat protein
VTHALVLAREDGAVVVEHVIPHDVAEPPCSSNFFGTGGFVVAPSGDIIVTSASPFLAARLNPPDLHEVWRRDDTGIGPFAKDAPPHLSGDRVVIGGNVRLQDCVHVFSVVTLDLANGASRACGDGTLDDGEVCDDGNLEDGDCCSSDCKSAAPDGASCTDGNVCTIGDRCDAGSCVPTGPLPCAPCGECNPEYGCFAAFDHAACARPTTTSAATLVVRRREDLARLDWTLESGPATARDDFGHPRATTGYALCGVATDRRVVLRATAPGGACGRRRCWQRTRRGFEYDNPRAPDGLSHLSLHSGPAGRTRFHARGAGKALVVPDLPVPGALTVELRRIDAPATCWAAVHGVVIKNAVHRYRATGG